MHRENYDEAYKELEAILNSKMKIVIDDAKRHNPTHLLNFTKLSDKVEQLIADVESLKHDKREIVAKAKKA